MTPRVFWDQYRESLRANGTWPLYRTVKQWGDFAIRLAEIVLQQQTAPLLDTRRKYFRADLVGVQGDGFDDWHVRVTFERRRRHPFQAFTIDNSGGLVNLPDPRPLYPDDRL
jgi:hypothetical protein